MNIALWIVRALLAFAFLGAGAMKVFAYEKYKAQAEKNGPTDMTRGLVTFIGFAEILGAIGIILPMAAKVAPWLSAVAAAALALVMLLAVIYHMRRSESPAAPAVLLVLALFVTVGRLAHWA